MKKTKSNIKKTHLKTVQMNKYQKCIQISFKKFTEFYQDFNIQECVLPNGRLSIYKVIKKLQSTYNIQSSTKHIKYYLPEGDIWLAITNLKSFQIQQDDFKQKIIKLQMKQEKQFIQVVMSEQEIEDSQVEDQEQVVQGKCRRLKQRKIKHVIQKVLKWRQLYAGIQNQQQNNTSNRIPLQQGAKIVKISKKTLDDYLSQLKKGKKYGFNFNDHKNQKVGVLRQFIRKVQKKNK